LALKKGCGLGWPFGLKKFFLKRGLKGVIKELGWFPFLLDLRKIGTYSLVFHGGRLVWPFFFRQNAFFVRKGKGLGKF